MEVYQIVTFALGILFLLLILILALEIPDPSDTVLKIWRIFLGLGAGGFAAGLLGFIEIEGQIGDWVVHAGGPIALTILIIFVPIRPIKSRSLFQKNRSKS
jgi:hypothetical protein